MAAFSKAILFYNEKSGQAEQDGQSETIRSHFTEQKIDLETVILPKTDTEINSIVKDAISRGVDLFVAAGGDGTVSLIGNSLIGTGLPLGVLPLGTGNLLAKELQIPDDLKKALELITAEESTIIQIDTFQLAGRSYILNMSVGISSEVMEETNSEEKRRLGVFAYLINFFQEILGMKLKHFVIDCDDSRTSYHASEILITNSRTTGTEPLEWVEDIAINDGALDLIIIRAANISDIVSILFSVFTQNAKNNPGIKAMQFRKHCRIETRTPLGVQADGDAVGETPVEVQVNPLSLNMIVSNANIYQERQSKEEEK